MRINTKRKRTVLLFIIVMSGMVLMWCGIAISVPKFTWKETCGTSRRDVLVFSENAFSLIGPMAFLSNKLEGIIFLYYPNRIFFLSFEDPLAVGTYTPI